jgi:hypothetical protein
MSTPATTKISLTLEKLGDWTISADTEDCTVPGRRHQVFDAETGQLLPELVLSVSLTPDEWEAVMAPAKGERGPQGPPGPTVYVDVVTGSTVAVADGRTGELRRPTAKEAATNEQKLALIRKGDL